ncbi:MAG TPA: FHA domain-containing protein [Solirubrobacteraceae bacterium]|nr:FHA domain-containing protein [Solirubrobacteraceae bacterium]
MSLQPVSVSLKFAFLVVLYLFLVWVALSAVRDLRRGRGSGRAYDDGYEERASEGPYDATGMYSAADLGAPDLEGREPRLLVERAAGHESGVAYDLSEPVTLGRGNVEIHLDDPFASTHHARITPEGNVLVIEDLGSTNGTYLNDTPLSGPQPLHDGDRIRIGDSEFSYLQ